MSERKTKLERAVLRWATVTDAFVSPWCLEMWCTDLTNSRHDESRIILAMKYLVSISKKPNLDTLQHVMDNNLDRNYVDIDEMKKMTSEGMGFFRMIWEAMNTSNHWAGIKVAMEHGQEKAPELDWSKRIAEAEMKMGMEGDAELPPGDREVAQEPF